MNDHFESQVVGDPGLRAQGAPGRGTGQRRRRAQPHDGVGGTQGIGRWRLGRRGDPGSEESEECRMGNI